MWVYTSVGDRGPGTLVNLDDAESIRVVPSEDTADEWWVAAYYPIREDLPRPVLLARRASLQEAMATQDQIYKALQEDKSTLDLR
ncbi:MAG TPA: hypothetical protein VFA07_15900 [Chthonomonadaceae bacterium]|nr:hypothetical protein [Chthonomonadaceae bacterium]